MLPLLFGWRRLVKTAAAQKRRICLLSKKKKIFLKIVKSFLFKLTLRVSLMLTAARHIKHCFCELLLKTKNHGLPLSVIFFNEVVVIIKILLENDKTIMFLIILII